MARARPGDKEGVTIDVAHPAPADEMPSNSDLVKAGLLVVSAYSNPVGAAVAVATQVANASAAAYDTKVPGDGTPSQSTAPPPSTVPYVEPESPARELSASEKKYGAQNAASQDETYTAAYGDYTQQYDPNSSNTVPNAVYVDRYGNVTGNGATDNVIFPSGTLPGVYSVDPNTPGGTSESPAPVGLIPAVVIGNRVLTTDGGAPVTRTTGLPTSVTPLTVAGPPVPGSLNTKPLGFFEWLITLVRSIFGQ